MVIPSSMRYHHHDHHQSARTCTRTLISSLAAAICMIMVQSLLAITPVMADYTVVATPREQTAWPESSVTWTRSPLSDVDDTLANLTLPGIPLQFDFPWYSSSTRSVYPDPNGGLFMSSAYVPPACGTNNAGVYGCSFSTSLLGLSGTYYSMLMMCTTDLNPSARVLLSPGVYGVQGTIRYASLPNVFLLRYDNVTLFFIDSPDQAARRWFYTFQVELYPSGDVIVHYDSYNDPRFISGSGTGGGRTIVVGVRAPPGATEVSPLSIDWTATDWPGTYAAKADMNTVPTLRYRPIGTSWCMSPRSASSSGGGYVRLFLRPSAPLQLASFVCWFGDVATVGTAAGSGSVEVLCPIPASSHIGTNYTAMLPYLVSADMCNTTLIANGTHLSYASLSARAKVLSCARYTSLNITCNITTTCRISDNTTVVLFRLAVGDPDVPSRQRFLPLSPASLLFTYYLDDERALLDPYDSYNDAQLACQWCSTWLSSPCPKDCTLTYLGNATTDTCGVCSGGTSGVIPDGAQDCEGICFGPFLVNITTGQCECRGTACLDFTLKPIDYMGDTTSVQYVWHFTHGSDNDYNNSIEWNEFDFTDNQLQVLFLPFTMPIYANQFTYFHVSQYGAIVPPTYVQSPCILNDMNAFASLFAGTLPSSCMVMAVSLTSMAVTSPAKVTWARSLDGNEVYVRWSSMPFKFDSSYSSTGYGRDIYESFQLTMMSSGHWRYTFYNLTDPATVPGLASGRNWMVGLRAGISTGSIPTPFGGVTLEQQWVGTGAAYTRDGVYVPRSAVVSNTSVLYCRLPAYMCVTPRYGPATGGNRVLLVGSTIDACFADIPMVCLFGGVVTGVAVMDDYNTISCVAPAGNVGTTVVLQLAVADTLTIISTGTKLFYSYWPDDDIHVANVSLLYTLGHFCIDCHQLTPPGECIADCAGAWAGTALLDSCGVCSGGTTNHTADEDIDCTGTCFGSAFIQTNGQCACALNSKYVCPYNTSAAVNTTRSYHYLFQTTNSGSVTLPSSWSPSLDQWTVINTTSTINGTSPLLTSMIMPFSFYFFGSVYRRVYISSDGAIILGDRPDVACVSHGASLSFTNHTICNFSVIAAGMTALDMRADDTILAYITNSSHAMVRWQSARLFIDPLATADIRASAVRQSMQITIGNDGTISLLLFNVTDPSIIGGAGYTRNWLVGVQQQGTLIAAGYGGSNEILYYASYTNSTMFNAGEYPSRALAVSGSTTSYCRISYTTCMSPRAGAASGNTRVKLFMPDNASSCMTLVPLWMDFGGGSVRAAAVWNASTISLDALSTAGINGTIVIVTVWDAAIGGAQLAFDGQPLRYMYISTTSSSGSSNSYSMAMACNQCGALIPSYCHPDCAGVYGGTAVIGVCGQCTGGTTTSPYNVSVDCNGNCYGPMTYTTLGAVGYCACDGGQADLFLCGLYSYLTGTDIGDTMNPLRTYELTILVIMVVTGLIMLSYTWIQCTHTRMIARSRAAASAVAVSRSPRRTNNSNGSGGSAASSHAGGGSVAMVATPVPVHDMDERA